jgi:hypothetical protein
MWPSHGGTRSYPTFNGGMRFPSGRAWRRRRASRPPTYRCWRTAGFIVGSPLFHGDYMRTIQDHSDDREALASKLESLGGER